MTVKEQDIAIARDLIGLALSEPEHDFFDPDPRGLLETVQGVERAEQLIKFLEEADKADLIRIAASLLRTMANTVAETFGDGRTAKDVLSWYATSFGQGPSEPQRP